MRTAMGVLPICRAAALMAAVACSRNLVNAQHQAAPPSASEEDDAPLADRLLELVARVPDFDTLGDPSSRTGRELKSTLSVPGDRIAAARAVLPIALDPNQSTTRRRDAFRLMSAILGRAKADDQLTSIVDDPDLGAGLAELRSLLVADARSLLGDLLADPHPGQPTEAEQTSPRRAALRPECLLPIELIALGHLGAGDDIVALFDEAEAGMRRRALERPGAPPIVDRLYWNTPFPLGTFVWPLGLAKGDAATARLMRLLDDAEATSDTRSLGAVLDALQLVDEPAESLLHRVRLIIEGHYEPRPVQLPEGTDPRVVHSQAWGDYYELFRTACIRYVSLGQRRFQADRDRAWLEPLLGWITSPGNDREPADLTLIRASSAELALHEVTDRPLQELVVEAALPRLGTGPAAIKDRAFLLALAAMPKPTVGAGADRRIAPAYAEAITAQYLRSSPRAEMHVAIRACGRWGRVPMLLDALRDTFRTRIGATQAYAHLAGPEARAELEALRANGPFEGSLAEADRAERDRLLGMMDDTRTALQDRVLEQIAFWLRADGVADDAIATRREALEAKAAALFRDDAIRGVALSKEYRNATAAAIRALAVQALGREPDDLDARFNDGFEYQLFALHDIWLRVERQYSFDWNLRQALDILAISDQLASRHARTAREGIAALRKRREDRIWEIGAFDVYAWVPELILMYEEAESLFGDDANAVRQDILQTFAVFRSSIGRSFLADVIADPTTAESIRSFATGLRPRPIRRLYDEVH